MDRLQYELGGYVIGAAVLCFWLGGTIVGGDFVGRHFGKRAGDWFSVIWGVGWLLGAWIWAALS